MDLTKELEGLFGANVALINLVTYEEERVIRTITRMSSNLGIYTWDLADGFAVIREAGQPLPKKEVTTDTLLPFLAQSAPQGSIFILKDFHHSWNQKKPYITRKIRNMAPGLRARNQFLIFLTPVYDLPAELKDDVIVVYVPLPEENELAGMFQELTKDLDRSKLPRPEVRQKLIVSALGLTTNQARLAFSRVWSGRGRFDEQGIDLVTWAKREVIRESGALEFWPATEGETDVGGLDLLKNWLKKREKAFYEEARSAGVPYPRGVALIGIPGTGKSLTAKMLSGLWKLPLLRLDVGALFASLLGESEQNMRRAIQLAETVSPCILWIDEMEKAFAGVGAGNLNSGAPTRVFGTFLTWMEERQKPVYVIATANDISGLDAALMSRFDRTFFLDLPNTVERREILTIHLKRTGIPFPERTFRIDELVEKTKGYVGREIERLIHEAHFNAFADSNRQIEQQDLLQTIGEVIPIEKSHAEIIEALRRWKTEGRAYPASSEERSAGAMRGRVIETP
jgi:MoxR-like ATPase